MTTRRQLLAGTVFGVKALGSSASPVDVPVLRLLNRQAACSDVEVRTFCSIVWDEAERAFQSCGVILRTVHRIGEVRLWPGGRPRFFGLESGMLNVVLTDRIPLHWDNGRSLAGVATISEGHHVCVIAMKNAHPNRLPFLAVNTVVHEMLHVFFGDIFVSRKGLLRGEAREAFVDWQATRLWLFRYGPDVKNAAQSYMTRLRL